jgi:methylenetetrahydrofolate reductase (NADPH)
MSDLSRAAAFVRDWSIEATRPSSADIARLTGIVPPGTAVYLSAVPTQMPESLAEAAARVRMAGFEPVPHIAARRFTETDLQPFLERVGKHAGLRRIMLVAGDDDRVAGPFAGGLEVIESGLLNAAGITAVGITGYPEGHPHLSAETVELALAAKIAAAARANLDVHIVSQFCFDAPAIIGWLRRLRARGIAAPVRIGLAGPTSFAGLMRYAALCGVKASARGLLRHGVPGGLSGQAGPDRLLQALLASPEPLGDIAPHFFSFGGLLKTAQYACERAAGGYTHLS